MKIDRREFVELSAGKALAAGSVAALGVVPGEAKAEKPAATRSRLPIVNHCLAAFGPDRVMFGGDWPVCTPVATLRRWVDALAEVIRDRSEIQRRKLWYDNAVRFYGL